MSVIAVLLCSAAQVTAATQAEFYGSLLRRGVAEFDAGRFAPATQLLRLAAFGFVESIEQYQLAQAYLAVAYDKLGDNDRARDAASRVLRAERVQRRFARVALPPAVRTQFERVAARVLTAGEVASLRGTEPLPPLRDAATATLPSQTPAQTPAVVDRVDVETARAGTPPAATPGQPARTDPATSGTSRPPRSSAPTQGAATPGAARQPNQTAQPPASQASATPQPAQTTTAPAPATSTPARTTTQTPAGTAATTPRATTPAPQSSAPQQTTTAAPQNPRPQSTTSAAQTTPPARTATPTPTPSATPRPVTLTPQQLATRLTAAERALGAANLTEARRLYREALASSSLDRATAILIAEGLYRARDFAGALAAFERVGTLRPGEEPYRYYIAVALYETGRYVQAKRELAAALPHIEVTADVARYRAKIETAAD